MDYLIAALDFDPVAVNHGVEYFDAAAYDSVNDAHHKLRNRGIDLQSATVIVAVAGLAIPQVDDRRPGDGELVSASEIFSSAYGLLDKSEPFQGMVAIRWSVSAESLTELSNSLKLTINKILSDAAVDDKATAALVAEIDEQYRHIVNTSSDEYDYELWDFADVQAVGNDAMKVAKEFDEKHAAIMARLSALSDA